MKKRFYREYFGYKLKATDAGFAETTTSFKKEKGDKRKRTRRKSDDISEQFNFLDLLPGLGRPQWGQSRWG